MSIELAKAKQIQVEASSATGAGTLQELIEANEIYRETDITVTQGEDTISIESSTGTTGTITSATITSSGVMSKDDKVKLSDLPTRVELTGELGVIESSITSMGNSKVDKEAGMSLVADAEISKLTAYPDVTVLDSAIDSKVSKEVGKELIPTASLDKLNDLPTDAVLTSALTGKVDVIAGSSLVDDAEILKLSQLRDDTTISSDLLGKVDKVTGKGLSEEDFTTVLKNKLDGLRGNTATDVLLDGKVDKEVGGQLITTLQSDKLDALPDSVTLALDIGNKVTKVSGKGLIDPAPVDGKEYARKDGTWVEVVGGGGGASALADLTDVDFGTPTDGQVLTYDAATQKSKFTDQAGGGGGDVEEAPLDGEAYGRKDGTWVVVPSPVDALLDFGYGTDKFLLNSDFPDDTKRYSGLVQLMNAPMRYVATPLISYVGGVVTIGRQIEYSMIAELSLINASFLVYKDLFGLGSEAYAPILTGATVFDTGKLTQLNNFTGDFSVTEASFYRNDYIDTGLKYLSLDIPAGLAGQKVSVSVTGAGVGLDFDPNGFSTIPLVPSISTNDLDLMFYAKPLYSGVDSSGFEYKIWFPDSLDTIYLETQNPNQHTLEVYF